MRPVPRLAVAALSACLLLIGCEEYNPAEPRWKPPADPPAPAELPALTRAKQVQVDLYVHEHLEPDDTLSLINRSDGALYDVEVTVNNDYLYVVPLIEMAETARVSETWLRTRQGHPFPSAQRVRMERVEVRYQGKLIASYDVNKPAP